MTTTDFEYPDAASESGPLGQVDRLLGRITGHRPGPLMVVVGSLHGNEPSGVRAVRRVLRDLAGKEEELTGDFVAFAGNLKAIAAQARFISRDLNRAWTPERMEMLRQARLGEGSIPEDLEQHQLGEELEAAFAAARGPIYVLDIHSTSGQGCPFVVISDTLRNREWAKHLPTPMVLGLEEELTGTLLDYLADRGYSSMGFEGGQHDEPSSIDHAEAAIWILMAAAGLIDPESPVIPKGVIDKLRRAGKGLPPTVDVRYRHEITPEDGFRMLPGFASFQPVDFGQHVANDRLGEIYAPAGGRILMPLYQEQGEDGFFIVRGFRPVWLTLSASLRRLRLDAVLHWLPGVRRHPERSATYIVNRRVARWFALEVFHLLGYQRESDLGDKLVLTRRPGDEP